jgi:hypothetical protein
MPITASVRRALVEGTGVAACERLDMSLDALLISRSKTMGITCTVTRRDRIPDQSAPSASRRLRRIFLDDDFCQTKREWTIQTSQKRSCTDITPA